MTIIVKVHIHIIHRSLCYSVYFYLIIEVCLWKKALHCIVKFLYPELYGRLPLNFTRWFVEKPSTLQKHFIDVVKKIF